MKRAFVIVLGFVLLGATLAACAAGGVAPTVTPGPAASTPVLATNTPVPPTNTPVPPTHTPVPTETAAPPTATAASTTAAPLPATAAPTATATPEPPTATPAPEPSWQPDGVIDEGEYAHQTEAAGVTFHWTNDAEHLYGALSAPTGGWVSVGFDPESRMQGATYVFGYVQNGQTRIEDMYGVRPAGPGSHPADGTLGGRNDILEYGGIEEGGVTVIEFKISLDSGDEYDRPLQPGETYTVLLAWGTGDDLESYHGGRGMGEIVLD